MSPSPIEVSLLSVHMEKHNHFMNMNHQQHTVIIITGSNINKHSFGVREETELFRCLLM